MSWRFRKRMRLFPGAWINLSKSLRKGEIRLVRRRAASSSAHGSRYFLLHPTLTTATGNCLLAY